MVVNGKDYYTTPFDLCGTPGTKFLVQTEREFWTVQEERLVFIGWQRWNAVEETWEFLSENPFIQIHLQQGGLARAVYQSAGYPG